MDKPVDNPVDKWRKMSRRKRILLIVAVVVAVIVIVKLWRMRGETTLSGNILSPGAPMRFIAAHDGSTPSKTVSAKSNTPIDDAGIRSLLGLNEGESINGQKLADWQALQQGALEVDGKWGPLSRVVARLYYWPCEYYVVFSQGEAQIMAGPTIHWESGKKGLNAQNRDNEFLCRWPSNIACIKRRHYGLSWGINQAVQHAGALGHVLRRIYELDPNGMNAATDGHAAELVQVTNASWDGKTWTEDANGENWNPRVMPVAGEVIWKSPWIERFGRLAKLDATRQAQWEVMDEHYVQKAFKLAQEYGFSDRQSIAVIFDSSNHLGNGGTRKVMRRAFPNGRKSGDRADILTFIKAYAHNDDARELKVENRRLAILRKTHPGVCYAA